MPKQLSSDSQSKSLLLFELGACFLFICYKTERCNLNYSIIYLPMILFQLKSIFRMCLFKLGNLNLMKLCSVATKNPTNKTYFVLSCHLFFYFWECCKIVTISSTDRAEAIIDKPGLLTVHIWSSVLSIVLFLIWQQARE